MKLVIEPGEGIWFDVIASGIRIRRCRLHRGPAGLPDLRLPRDVSMPPELFAATRREAIAVMGGRVSGS